MNLIHIVSVSTGSVDLLTNGMLTLLKQKHRLILRTDAHLLTKWLAQESIPYESLDSLYESAETFDSFNQAVAQYVLDAVQTETVVYAVPDISTDSTVSKLLSIAPQSDSIKIHAGISHASRCLASSKINMTDIRLTAAESFLDSDAFNPRLSYFISELHSKTCAGMCKLKMMELLDDNAELNFFSCDDQGNVQYKTIQLFELDRQTNYDHLTAVYYKAKELEQRKRFSVEDLLAVMVRLRGKGGCPWDAEQTHESILPNLLEESYEYIEAVHDKDEEHMCEELGDVLLQVIFHAVIAQQHSEFTLSDVSTGVTAKLIERHPHVFGSVKADTAEEVLDNWENIKRKKRGLDTTVDAMLHVSKGLSAAIRAAKVQHKAAKVGFDFPDEIQALQKVQEEHDEVLECLNGKHGIEEELGDLLFSVINVCRLSNVDADIVLNATTNKFISRFQGMIHRITSEGKSIEDLTLNEMDVYWMKEKHISMNHNH